MDRLTTRCAGVAVMAWEHEEQHSTQEWIDMLTERLAAYEDTGLAPEDILGVLNESSLLKLTAQMLGVSPEQLRKAAREIRKSGDD